MHIVRIEDVETPVNLQAADEVFPSRLYVLESGNACTVTTALTYIGGGESRVIVSYSWLCIPYVEEQETMEEYVANMMGMGQPEFIATSIGSEASQRVGNDWLRDGKAPLGTN